MELQTAAFVIASVALFAIVGLVASLKVVFEHLKVIKHEAWLLQNQLTDLNLKMSMYENVMRALIEPQPMEIADDYH